MLQNDLHNFSVWAFGQDYVSLKVQEFVPRWNIRHGKLYTIVDTSNEEEILAKMRALWLDTVGKDSKEKMK